MSGDIFDRVKWDLGVPYLTILQGMIPYYPAGHRKAPHKESPTLECTHTQTYT